MLRTLFAAAFVAAASLTATAADTKYTLTGDNTTVTFVGKKPDGKHVGGFKKVSGTATVPDGDLTKLTVTLDIDTDSIFADDAKLTGHLKSADFFDVKNQPKATFKSTKVEKKDKLYIVTGDLTMVGKTKSIDIPMSLTEKDGVLTASTTFPLNRTLWGMVYGKGKIDDVVDLTLKVKAKK